MMSSIRKLSVLTIWLLLMAANVSAAGWEWNTDVDGNDDVYIELGFRNVLGQYYEHFKFYIGAGGNIKKLMRDGANLLAPSFDGEETDRVIQWCFWETDTTKDLYEDYISCLNSNQQRFNINQSGSHGKDCPYNSPSDMFAVTVCGGQSGNKVWFYSTPYDIWYQSHDHTGRIACYTEFEPVSGDYALKVRRVVRVPRPKDHLNNYVNSLDLLLDMWTPMRHVVNGNDDIIFDNISLELNSSGESVSDYTGSTGSQTNEKGYAVFYKDGDITTEPVLGVVFGTSNIDLTYSSASSEDFDLFALHQTSLIEFSTFIKVYDCPQGSFIDQTFYLVPKASSNGALKTKLDSLVSNINNNHPPAVYDDTDGMDATLEAIAETLDDYYNGSFGIYTPARGNNMGDFL